MQERFQRFTNLITSISRSIYRMKTEAMAKYDLKSSHLSCMYYLTAGKARTAAQLAKLSEEDKANVSRTLGELEKRGLITREIGSQGRPKRTITLTVEGAKIGEFLREHIENIFQIVSEDIDEAERDAMYRSLTRIDKRLRMLSEADGNTTQDMRER